MLAQLACEVQVLRAIPRAVFHPVPNVDSVLVGMRRRAGADAGAGAGEEVSPALRALVAGAFAHRRKTLAGSLALAAGEAGAQSRQLALPHRSREQLREALVSLGHPPDARAERLSPEDFRALARLLEL